MKKRKPKTNRRQWSEEEIHLLQSRYAEYGPQYLAQKIARSPAAIRSKANNMGLVIGDLKGWVLVGYVAAESGHDVASVRERAKRSGFSRHLKANRLAVPEAWATAYINKAHRDAETDKLIDHYYDVPKLAKLFNRSIDAIHRWLNGESQYGSRILNNVQIAVTSGRTHRRYLFNPYDVEKELKKFNERPRAKANTRSKPRP